MSELVTRIPAEQMNNCDSWLIPEMDASKVIPAVKQQTSFSTKKTRSDNKRTPKIPVDHTIDTHVNENESIETIEDVTVEAADIEPISADELKKITEEAEKEGYDIGYKEGLEKGTKDGVEQGLKDTEASILEKTTQLQAIAQALLAPLKQEQAVLEKQMVNMVCQLTRSIIKKELTTDSSIIKETVSHAFALLQDKEKNITIHLNEQDIETIQTSLKDKDITVVYEVDNSLLPGGCRIDNAHSHIDASIDKQLTLLLDDFVQQRYASPEDPSEDSVEECINDAEENIDIPVSAENTSAESTIKKESDDTDAANPQVINEDTDS